MWEKHHVAGAWVPVSLLGGERPADETHISDTKKETSLAFEPHSALDCFPASSGTLTKAGGDANSQRVHVFKFQPVFIPAHTIPSVLPPRPTPRGLCRRHRCMSGKGAGDRKQEQHWVHTSRRCCPPDSALSLHGLRSQQCPVLRELPPRSLGCGGPMYPA